jgi:hypothetical protein
VSDLNTKLANLVFTFRNLAEQSERRAAAMRAERDARPESQRPFYPDPAAEAEAAAYWRRHEKAAAEGYVWHEEPPAGVQPLSQLGAYRNALADATECGRVRYSRPAELGPIPVETPGKPTSVSGYGVPLPPGKPGGPESGAPYSGPLSWS